MRRILICCLALPALAACGQAGRADHGPAGRTGDGPAGSVVATFVLPPAAGGPVYVEGARPEVSLRGPDGREVTLRHGFRFTGLVPGGYTLRAGERPCDGSCTVLDPLTDDCSTRLRVASGPVRVRVLQRVGKPCELTVAAPE